MSRRETRSSAGLGAGTDFLIIDKPLAQVSKDLAKYKGQPIRWAAARMGVETHARGYVIVGQGEPLVETKVVMIHAVEHAARASRPAPKSQEAKLVAWYKSLDKSSTHYKSGFEALAEPESESEQVEVAEPPPVAPKAPKTRKQRRADSPRRSWDDEVKEQARASSASSRPQSPSAQKPTPERTGSVAITNDEAALRRVLALAGLESYLAGLTQAGITSSTLLAQTYVNELETIFKTTFAPPVARAFASICLAPSRPEPPASQPALRQTRLPTSPGHAAAKGNTPRAKASSRGVPEREQYDPARHAGRPERADIRDPTSPNKPQNIDFEADLTEALGGSSHQTVYPPAPPPAPAKSPAAKNLFGDDEGDEIARLQEALEVANLQHLFAPLIDYGILSLSDLRTSRLSDVQSAAADAGVKLKGSDISALAKVRGPWSKTTATSAARPAPPPASSLYVEQPRAVKELASHASDAADTAHALEPFLLTSLLVGGGCGLSTEAIESMARGANRQLVAALKAAGCTSAEGLLAGADVHTFDETMLSVESLLALAKSNFAFDTSTLCPTHLQPATTPADVRRVSCALTTHIVATVDTICKGNRQSSQGSRPATEETSESARLLQSVLDHSVGANQYKNTSLAHNAAEKRYANVTANPEAMDALENLQQLARQGEGIASAFQQTCLDNPVLYDAVMTEPHKQQTGTQRARVWEGAAIVRQRIAEEVGDSIAEQLPSNSSALGANIAKRLLEGTIEHLDFSANCYAPPANLSKEGKTALAMRQLMPGLEKAYLKLFVLDDTAQSTFLDLRALLDKATQGSDSAASQLAVERLIAPLLHKLGAAHARFFTGNEIATVGAVWAKLIGDTGNMLVKTFVRDIKAGVLTAASGESKETAKLIAKLEAKHTEEVKKLNTRIANIEQAMGVKFKALYEAAELPYPKDARKAEGEARAAEGKGKGRGGLTKRTGRGTPPGPAAAAAAAKEE